MMPSGLTLIPAFDLAHVVDRQDSYTDSQSNKVSAQTIRLTEASFGLGFEQPMQIGGRDMRLTGGLSGIHSNLDAPGQSERSSRGRIDIGADIILGPRATLKLNAHYDGIGASDFDAHGADTIAPRGGDDGHAAIISFTLCDDIRERIEHGEEV